MFRILTVLTLCFSMSHAVVTKASLFRVTMYLNSTRNKCFYRYQGGTDTVSVYISGSCPYRVTIDTESGRVFW